MRFKDEFIKEICKRLKENIDVIESSFEISGFNLIKKKLFDVNKTIAKSYSFIVIFNSLVLNSSLYSLSL